MDKFVMFWILEYMIQWNIVDNSSPTENKTISYNVWEH